MSTGIRQCIWQRRCSTHRETFHESVSKGSGAVSIPKLTACNILRLCRPLWHIYLPMGDRPLILSNRYRGCVRRPCREDLADDPACIQHFRRQTSCNNWRYLLLQPPKLPYRMPWLPRVSIASYMDIRTRRRIAGTFRPHRPAPKATNQRSVAVMGMCLLLSADLYR